MLPPPPVLFGLAGWSYDDWKDVVYPRQCKDTLRAVAQRVPLLEINASFYAAPAARTCAGWVERTADLGTCFTAKVPQEFTHVPQFEGARLQPVLDGFAPLLASGRCLAFLAQFHAAFPFAPSSLQRVRALATSFGAAAPLCVEVRHPSWNAPAALAALRELGVGVAALDYPAMAEGFARDVPGVHARGLAYFRLHGRNPAWFEPDAGRDRVYDWEYTPREVQQLQARIGRLLAADPVRLLVVANNHFHGKAMRVIEQLLAWYRGQAAGGGVT